MMKIEQFDIEKDVSVNCTIGEIIIPGTYKTIGHLQVKGLYKPGSAGSDDAKHIIGMIAYAHARYFHTSWILDLSDLVYEWGDEMDWVLDGFEDIKSVQYSAIVLGIKCIDAVATLSGMDKKPKDILDSENVFDDINQAYEYLLTKIT